MVHVTACSLEDAYGGFCMEHHAQQKVRDPPPLPVVELAEDEAEARPAAYPASRPKSPARAPAVPAKRLRSARCSRPAPADMGGWWPLCAAVLVILLLLLVILVAYLASSHASLVREIRYLHGARAPRWA